MRSRWLVVGVAATVLATAAACSSAPEAKPATPRDEGGRRIVGSWGPGSRDGYFVAEGDVWVVASCTGEGAMQLSLYNIPNRFGEQKPAFECPRNDMSYLMPVSVQGEWRGAVGWETSATVASWKVEAIERSLVADTPVTPSSKPLSLWYLLLLGILTAVGISISAEYLQLSLQFSRIPIFQRESFLEQIRSGQAFWLRNPVLLAASEAAQYLLLGFLWWLTVRVGIDPRW